LEGTFCESSEGCSGANYSLVLFLTIVDYSRKSIKPVPDTLYCEKMVLKEKIEEAIELIRPSLQADGGDIELVDITDGVVKVKLTGACGSCPMSQMTLKQGVERVLKQHVPEVKSVISV